MAFTPGQERYRFYNDDGSESASTAAAAQNTDVTVDIGGSNAEYQLRIGLQESGNTGGPAGDDYQLQYSKNGGAWANVTTSSSNVKAINSTNLTDGGATTERLTGGTGSWDAGKVSEDGLVDNSGLGRNAHKEHLFALQTVNSDLVATDTLDFRVLLNGSTLPGGYAVTPRITATAAAGRTGTLAATLGALTLAAAGAVLIAGTTAKTLGAVTVSAAGGTAGAHGTLNQALGDIIPASAGAVQVQGALARTLGPVTSTTAGGIEATGSLAKTLGAVTLSAAGSSPTAEVDLTLSGIARVDWQYESPGSPNISGWDGSCTTITDPWRAKWRAHVEMAAVQGEAKIRALRSFLAQRKGQLVPFRLYATGSSQNSNSGVTVSSTAAQGAISMAISGAATTLKDGQFATVNGQLLCMTADQAGSTIAFRPPLRQQATSGTTVVTSRPYALVYMASASSGWQVGPARLFKVSFDVVEAILETDAAAPEA